MLENVAKPLPQAKAASLNPECDPEAPQHPLMRMTFLSHQDSGHLLLVPDRGPDLCPMRWCRMMGQDNRLSITAGKCVSEVRVGYKQGTARRSRLLAGSPVAGT